VQPKNRAAPGRTAPKKNRFQHQSTKLVKLPRCPTCAAALVGLACPRCQREPGVEIATGPVAKIRAAFLGLWLRAGLTAREHQVVLAVMLHTWAAAPTGKSSAGGRRPEWWETSFSKIGREAGLDRNNARRAMTRMASRGLLIVAREGRRLLVRIAPLGCWRGESRPALEPNRPMSQNDSVEASRNGSLEEDRAGATGRLQSKEAAEAGVGERSFPRASEALIAPLPVGEIPGFALVSQRHRRNPAAEIAGKVAAAWGLNFRAALRAVSAAARQGGGLDAVGKAVEAGVLGNRPSDPLARLVALVRRETGKAVRVQQEEVALEALPEAVRGPLREFAARSGLPLASLAEKANGLVAQPEALADALEKPCGGAVGWRAWDAVVAATRAPRHPPARFRFGGTARP
jgi:hypothetical protein